MPVTTRDQTERRSTNTTDWLVAMCSEFSASTGWDLTFVPDDRGGQDGFDRRELDWCWHTEITDGDRRIGALHLDVPTRSQPDLTFDSAYRLADLIAAQVNRVLISRRQVDVQAGQIGSLFNPTSPTDSDSDDVHMRLAVLMRACVSLLRYHGAALFVLDPDGRTIRLRLSHGILEHDIPARRRVLTSAPGDMAALETGLSLVTQRHSAAMLCLPEDISTGVVVSVENRLGPMGTLWLFDRRSRDPNTNERDLLAGFGRQLADVLEYVVLQHDSEDHQRLSREIQVVAATHGRSDVCKSFPGCEVALRLRSCCEVGGDVCELLPLDEFRTAILIGDASGHGIPANSVMASARGAVHALLEARNQTGFETDELVGTVNRALMRITVAHQFISLILAVYDSRDRSLTYTNAGHPPALHVRGSEVRSLESQGMLLGIVEAAGYELSKIPLRSGDLLIMFSDGILEARNPKEQFFQQDGVLAAINGKTTEPVGDIRDSVWDTCELHAAGRDEDDRSLLVMRVL